MEKLTDGTTECLLVQEREIAIAIKRERKVWTVDGESAEYSLLNTSGDDYDPNAFSTTLSIPASFFSQQKLGLKTNSYQFLLNRGFTDNQIPQTTAFVTTRNWKT